jgi:hypothetical protein
MFDQWSPIRAALMGFVAGSLMYLVFGPLIGNSGPSEPTADLLEFAAFAGTSALAAIALAVGRNRLVRRRTEQVDQKRRILLAARDNHVADGPK